MKEKIEEIVKRIDKIENIYEVINKLTIQIEKLATETMYLREDQNKLANRIDNLESKPEKRWDTLITSIITGIVGAIIGIIVASLKR